MFLHHLPSEVIFHVAEFLDSLSDIAHLLLMLTSENSHYFSFQERDDELDIDHDSIQLLFYWKTLLANVLMSHIEQFIIRVRSENYLKMIKEIKKKGLGNYHQCAEIILKASTRWRCRSLELRIGEMMERYYVGILKEQFGPQSLKFNISECVELLTMKRTQEFYSNFFKAIVKCDNQEQFMSSLKSIIRREPLKCYAKNLLKKLIKSNQLEIITNSNSEIITNILHYGVQFSPEYSDLLPDIIKILKINLSLLQAAKLFSYLIGSDILDSISIGNDLGTVCDAFHIILSYCKASKTIKEIQAFKNLVQKQDPSLEIWSYIKDEQNRSIKNQELILNEDQIELFDILEIKSVCIRNYKHSNARFELIQLLRRRHYKLDKNDILIILFTPAPEYLFEEYVKLFQFCQLEYGFNIYEEYDSSNLVCNFFKLWRSTSANLFFEAIIPNELILLDKLPNGNILRESVSIYLDRIYYSKNPKSIVDYLQEKFSPSIFDCNLLECMIYRKKFALDSLNSNYLCDYVLPLITCNGVSFQDLADSLISKHGDPIQDFIMCSKNQKGTDEYIMSLYIACISLTY